MGRSGDEAQAWMTRSPWSCLRHLLADRTFKPASRQAATILRLASSVGSRPARVMGIILHPSAFVLKPRPQRRASLACVGPLGGDGDRFGHSVSVMGDNLLIGAPEDGTLNSGSVYLVDGTTGEVLLTFNNPGPQPQDGDGFGSSVAVVGDNVLIGARGDDTQALDAGAAYSAHP